MSEDFRYLKILLTSNYKRIHSALPEINDLGCLKGSSSLISSPVSKPVVYVGVDVVIIIIVIIFNQEKFNENL